MNPFFRSSLSILLFFFVASTSGYGQIFNPVKWNFCQNQLDEQTYELHLTATIAPGWHLYSMNAGEGPIPTSFDFNNVKGASLKGNVREPKPIEHYDPNFESNLRYFEHEVTFMQTVVLENEEPATVAGELTFMVCTDSNCLPPEYVDFTYMVPNKVDCNGKEIAVSFSLEPNNSPNNDIASKTDQGGTVELTTEPAEGGEEPQNNAEVDEAAVAAAAKINEEKTSQTSSSGSKNQDYTNTEILEAGCGDELGGEADKSIWGIFIAGMLGGLLALLTPCVFPMIPLTVSFFTKQSKTKAKGITNAIIYALSIIGIYVGLGFLVTVSLGADALNAMASNVWFNLAFFVIFVVFAMSFFGAFEITLPSSWVSKADTASDKGGLIGIFFMAFTLSLVSFSCTGPIIGTLLVEAARGGSAAGPLAGMTGFSMALALPFAMFAAFPGWLNSLPKSGGWLNSVKVVLGFVELALALKFLSVVDLAYHWEFLTREIFLSLWIIIFALLGLYLIGKLKFSHDSDMTHIPVFRLVVGIFAFAFAIYLIPGLWGAPVKLMSGIAPPSFYKEWIEHEGGAHCTHGIDCFHDYEAGMAFAKKEGKPVLIDFTGWSCVNCRKMEDNVWPDQRIFSYLEEDYVLISLYVDDKEELPKSQQYVSDFTNKKVKTVGNKWSEMQAKRYGANSQPYYVLVDHEENLLASPRSYTPEIGEYATFLEAGLCRFNKRLAAKKEEANNAKVAQHP